MKHIFTETSFPIFAYVNISFQTDTNGISPLLVATDMFQLSPLNSAMFKSQ